MFNKILIANRGEIAVRVLRTAREMGLRSVAVYSERDRDALHVQMADEAFLLGDSAPAASYLNVERIIRVAQQSGTQAVHPGYGFLAENAAFARAVIEAGLVWIGPHPKAIEIMGDKVRARSAMLEAGVPVVPGGTTALANLSAAREAARSFGFPLALKASGGGGGKGLKIARTVDELEAAFTTARREAQAYFQNPAVYAERYLENPKHIELQILADKHGNVVHLGERDCSLQRRHQKVWEEAPARIEPAVRHKLQDAGLKAAQAIEYDSVGTIECLVYGDDFYFLEMNTRIQVEHTVTEMITGIDLVREQIRVAAGEALGYTQDGVRFFGHAIEGRINAEDPALDFRPSPGVLSAYREPGGPGVRIDSAASVGFSVAADYDSMIAKLIVWGPTRVLALSRMRRCIDEYVIEGVPTTLPLLRQLSSDQAVVDDRYGTATLEEFASQRFSAKNLHHDAVVPSAAAKSPQQVIRVEVNDKLFRVRLLDAPGSPPDTAGKAPRPASMGKTRARVAGNTIPAPMHGIVVALECHQGSAVKEGQVVAVIEAMKMMNEVHAHKAGTVAAVHVAAGDTVEALSPLVTLT
ncbi:MAG: acetyl-CoA carboxylase biotin carboxylase subunit [Candidatus Eremiobacteraeota bacterium]|nr:acetyl-CoA carboxylase biotin carboxylase subunit [Candidatus Eremiobacteraeota bacterium]